MRWWRAVALVALAVVAIAAAGCAGRGEASGDDVTDEEREEALLAFSECMREQGVDMPDPETTEGGKGLRIRRAERANDGDREDFEEAREACEEHLEGTFQEISPEERAEMQDRMLEFTQCMREEGIDLPDPEFGNGGNGPPGAFVQRLGADLDDPEFQEADEKCREEVFEGQEGPHFGVQRSG